jgi:hypothetical protein
MSLTGMVVEAQEPSSIEVLLRSVRSRCERLHSFTASYLKPLCGSAITERGRLDWSATRSNPRSVCGALYKIIVQSSALVRGGEPRAAPPNIDGAVCWTKTRSIRKHQLQCTRLAYWLTALQSLREDQIPYGVTTLHSTWSRADWDGRQRGSCSELLKQLGCRCNFAIVNGNKGSLPYSRDSSLLQWGLTLFVP